MKILRLTQIVDDHLYRIDLVQQTDGTRFTHLRSNADVMHPESVFTTNAMTGSAIRSYLLTVYPKDTIMTECGKSFILDAHGSWMIEEELLFWRECRNKDKSEWLNGPWVNGIMPAQYGS